MGERGAISFSEFRIDADKNLRRGPVRTLKRVHVLQPVSRFMALPCAAF